MSEETKKGRGKSAKKKHELRDGFYNDPHPYGVQPSGNAYFCSAEESSVRPRGLGRLLSALTDEALLEVLGFLDAAQLAACSVASRVLYVFAHHSDLWRDLTLRRWEGLPLEYLSSWKQTFMSLGSRSGTPHAGRPAQRMDGDRPVTALPQHQPISVRGVFSNLLHRAWACHTCDLASACPGFYRHSDVDRRSHADCSVETFIAEYEKQNKPLVLTGAVDYWPALQRWGGAYLAAAGELAKAASGKDPTFRATSATAPVAATFTLRGYFNYLRQAREEAPLYLFERDFAKKVRALEGDYDVPVYFRTADDHRATGQSDGQEQKGAGMSAAHGLAGTDLFRVFGSVARPDYRWLICGPKRSGSIFHIDPNQTNAWNVSIQGRKKWIFYPPDVHPPGVVSSTDGADVTVPISTGEWLLSFWDMHLEARRHPDPAQRPLEVIVHPGEVVFVPHGYWHMVVNLDDCIALTHNYVSLSNLPDCLKFLRDTPDQISGVRDRTEAIDPEGMYELFQQKLVETGVMTQEQLQEAVALSLKRTELAGLPSIVRKKRKLAAVAATEPAEAFSFSFF